MRHNPQLLVVVPLAAVLFGCANPGAPLRTRSGPTPPETIILSGARVFDVSTGTLGPAQDILVEDGRIVNVGPRIAGQGATRHIDCSGKFALPGLFDCHTHLVHLTKGSDDELKAQLAAFAAKGVTQVRDVGGPIALLRGIHDRIAGGEIAGPEVFCAGPMLEGSPLTFASKNEESPGFTVAIDTPEDVDRVLADLARQGATCVKTFYKMDPAIYRHLVGAARHNGLRIVHDPGPPLFHRIPVDVALDLGVTSIEHAKAPWPVVLTDELRAEHDTLVSPETSEMAQMLFMMRVSALGAESVSRERLRRLADQMREKHACLCPTLQVFAVMEEVAIEQIKERQGLKEVPELMRAMIRRSIAGMEEVSRLIVGELAARGVRLLVGQDGSDPAGTFGEMRRLKDCGVSEAEILKGATIYPAEWLGVAERLGAVEPGKQANILVVDGNPLEDIGNVESTFLVLQNGKVAASVSAP